VCSQAFADSKFKGLRTWKAVHTALRAAGVRSLAPGAAAAATAPRLSLPGTLAALAPPAARLLDVREPDTFAGGHATGALNVPLYAPLARARFSMTVCVFAWFPDTLHLSCFGA
jgi:3-mercaptopyruvate sulfurtransferase SseA